MVKLVSSAKLRTLNSRAEASSLVYSKYRKCPNVDPCGNPQVTVVNLYYKTSTRLYSAKENSSEQKPRSSQNDSDAHSVLGFWRQTTPWSKLSAKSKRLILQLPAVTPSFTRLLLSIHFLFTTKRSGEGKHPYQSPEPTVKGFQ